MSKTGESLPGSGEMSMSDPIFYCKSAATVRVAALTGCERLGDASSFDLELISHEPVEPAAILGHPAALELTSPFGDRLVHGIVTRFVVVATSQAAPSRRYEVTLRSFFDVLSLRRRTRVF